MAKEAKARLKINKLFEVAGWWLLSFQDGCQTKGILRYKTGASIPSIATLVKIAKVLKRPAGYFLDE